VSHDAATPPGLTVTVTARLTAVQGRRLSFGVEAHNRVNLINHGTHQRAVINRARFDAKAQAKRAPSG
jgi:fluoroacetyl-CoA thioesterase